MNFEYDIFLSFSSKDETEAKRIWQKLRSSGLRIFWSDETLKQSVGQSFFDVIQKALVHSKHFVLLWTTNAKTSNWVKLEYETFFQKCYMTDIHNRRLIIFRGKDVHQTELPPFLSSIQTTQSVSEIITITGGLDIRVLQKENKALKDQLSQLKGKMNTLQDQNTEISHHRKELQEKVAHSQKEIANLKQRLSETTDIKEEISQQNQKLQEKVSHSQKEIVDLQKRLSETTDAKKATTDSPKIEIIKDTNESKNENQTITNTIGITFNLIQAGTFMMGSPEKERKNSNAHMHKVTITRSFYMGITPVTQKQWQVVMNNNPSAFKGNDCPVETVSWNDAQAFIKKLNEMEKNETYRLPTEAEWEYACRAGSTTRYCFGDDEKILKDYAWYGTNSGGKTHPVKQKESNAWGLYDMHGNVWEWCEDWYGDYPNEPVTDPSGPASGAGRVIRGGGWVDNPGGLRSAIRNCGSPGYRGCHIGFRLLRTT